MKSPISRPVLARIKTIAGVSWVKAFFQKLQILYRNVKSTINKIAPIRKATPPCHLASFGLGKVCGLKNAR